MLTAIVSIVVGSQLVLLQSGDPICAGAPKGWLRGVVRLVDETAPPSGWRKAASAPNTTVIALAQMPENAGALDGQGDYLGQATISAEGYFSLKRPAKSYRLVLVKIEAQLRYDVDVAFLTINPELFPNGLCLEVFLYKKELKGVER